MAIFIYDGIGAVETGELPSGDITVRHPMNDRLRDIVEPICRGRGRWKAEYNNWIVFKQFANCVHADLEKQGRRIA
jgi:hypothetical protein